MAMGKNPLGGRKGFKHNLTTPPAAKSVDNLFAEKPAVYLLILDFFKGFFVRRGVNYEQLRLIVQVKMAINTRALQNPLTDSSNRFAQSAPKGKRQSLFKGMALQGVFGILFSLVLLLPIPDFSVYFLLYSVLFVLFITMLIPQLAQVFLSGEDAQVLPVRPVAARVLSLAKVVQVSIYCALNYLLYFVPAIVVGFIKRGIMLALLSIPSSLLLCVFALLLALALYLLVARFFSGEKLRNMITYVQILLSMFSFATYQLITPLVDLFGKADLSFSPWMLLWPPAWFSAPYALIAPDSPSILVYVSTGLGILSVIVLAVLYFLQSAALERRLQDLAMQKEGGDRETSRVRDFFSILLCRSPQERAYFRFSWQMMRHERSFKTAVYPSLVTWAVLPYIMVVTTRGDTLAAGLFIGMPMFFLYMSVVGIVAVILSVQMSDYAEAGWIFRVIPKNTDGAYATALAKCVWAKLYVPLFLLQFPLQFLIHGRNGVLTIGILFFLSYLVTQGLIEKMNLVRPFTMKRVLIQQSGCGYMVIMFGLWIVFALLHGALQVYVSYGIEFYVSLLALLSVLAINFYRGKKVFRD